MTSGNPTGFRSSEAVQLDGSIGHLADGTSSPKVNPISQR